MSKELTLIAAQREFDSVDDAIKKIKQEFDRAVDFAEITIATLEEKIQSSTGSTSYPGLNFLTLRDALCNNVNANLMQWTPNILATDGSGPWDANEFDQFLLSRGFEPVAMPHTSIDGIILGAQGWSEENLVEQIYDRDASSLRIYTQELFVVGLILAGDPYEFLDQTAINEVGHIHPGIQFLLNQNFAWPWSVSGDHTDGEEWELDDSEWAHESALKLLGYSANAQGPSESERRRILKIAFESSKLDGVETNEQRQRWGTARSAKRLHAISHFLSWLLNFQGGEKPAAKEKWKSDLEWLKKSFYKKTMRFIWPVSARTKLTVLNPGAAWPFKNEPLANATHLPNPNPPHSVSTSINLCSPSPSLAQITGPDKLTVGTAVKLIRQYILKNNLQDPITLDIRTDQLIFSLSGKKILKDHELSSVARWHLS